MTIYDISQYAPHIMAALCLVLMVGLPGPTIQKPHTWHMTLFIVMAFSLLNVAMAPVYQHFTSAASAADITHNQLMMNYAYIYSFLGASDFFTFVLIRKFSQRGRVAIAFLMAAFISINLMTIIDILTTSIEVYEINMFGFNLLAITDSVYSSYASLIVYLNFAQLLVILGASNGWSRGNISNLASSILASMRAGTLVSGGAMVCNRIRYSEPNKRYTP